MVRGIACGVVGLTALLMVPALGGCSLLVEFEAECEVVEDCASVGAGLSCVEGLCVSAATVDEPVDLLTAPCLTLYGADSPEEALGGDYLIIGTILPKSGGLADFGPDMEKSVAMAIAEINQGGGLADNTRLAVLGCDSATDSDTAVAAAEHLVEVAKVPLIIGPAASGNVIDVFTQVAKAAGVVVITPSGTSPSITNQIDDDLLWRTVPSDAIQGEAIAEYIADVDYQRVAVYNRNDAYGSGLRDAIFDTLCADTANCTADRYFSRSWDPADDVYDFDLPALAEFEPEITVVIAFPDDAGAQFLNQASKDGHSNFIVTDGMKSDGLGQVPDGGSEPLVEYPLSLCKMVATAPAAPTGTNYAGFEDRFEGKWGHKPGLFTATSYDAAYLAAYAAVAAGGAGEAVTGASLAQGLKRLSKGTKVEPGASDFVDGKATLANGGAEGTIDYAGASGELNFDPDTGEAPGEVESFRYNVDDAAFVSTGVLLTLDESGESQYQAPVDASGLIGETCTELLAPGEGG